VSPTGREPLTQSDTATRPVRAAVGLMASRPELRDGTIETLALELERQGQPVVILSLEPQERGGRHVTLFPQRRLRATVALLVHDPGALRRALLHVLCETWSYPWKGMRAFRLLPSAIALAKQLPGLVVTHIHSVPDPESLTVASLASRLADATLSVADQAESLPATARWGRRHIQFIEHFSPWADERTRAASLISTLHRAGSVRLREAEAQIVAAAEASGLSVSRLRRLHSRNDSRIGEITVLEGATQRHLILKQHTTRAGQSRPAADRASHEIRIMSHLWQQMDVTADAETIACTVPRPLEGNPERGIVIMEPAKGTALDVLMSGVTRRSELRQALAGPVRNSGIWLRRMQDCTAYRSDSRSVVAEVAKLAQADLQVIAADDRQIRRRRADIAAALQGLEKQLLSRPLTVTGRHGDFWPGNIFVSERRIEVIDFEGFREGLPLEDVAYFLIFLELMFPRFGGGAPGLADAFLEGYGIGTGETMDFFFVTSALQMLARQIALPSRSPIRLWTLRHLRKRLLGSLT
jgi:hypothetical protein